MINCFIKINIFSKKRNTIVFILFLLFFIIYNGTAQTSDDDIGIDSEIEYTNIEVLFLDYKKDAISFTLEYKGFYLEEWRDIVEMKIISGEYENKIFSIIIGEYPVREQFKSSNIYRIMIDKTRLAEYLYNNDHLYSSFIKFIE
jgi:hypothetical protein